VTWRKRREIAEPTPEAMAKACRKLARDMRREAAAGWDDVELIGRVRITRAEAARRMDAAAERWTRRRNDGRR
jgi:hypothetical protein